MPTLLEYLHEFFYGPQDEYDKLRVSNTPFKREKLLETKTVTFTKTFDKLKSPRTYHDLYNCKSFNSDDVRKGVTNFKISPSSAIDSLEFIVGGQLFEKHQLFRELNTDPKIFMISGNNVFPILQFHKLTINFETNCDTPITVSYDIVELVDYDGKKCSDWMTMQEQFTGTEELKDSLVNKIRIHFNHPIIRLYAFLPDDVEDARVLLNSQDHNLLLTPKDNYYTIEFGEETSINFSRIDSVEIQVTTKTPHPHFKSRVYGINKCIIRVMSEMAGSAFSK